MKLNFIEDKDINLEKDDLLGTKPYASTLLDIIEKADTPFTIGLFGGWGTGKSSIVKTIKEKYNNSKISKTKVFVYDAWKYSKDSFRRTFILKLREEFKLEEGEEYQNFYNDKHEEIEGKTGISKNWWIYFIVFIVSLFLINLTPKLDGKEFEWSTFVISAFISAIIVFVTKTYTEYKISITKPKTFAPEKFEDAFVDALQKITKPKKIKKVSNWFKTSENKTIFADKLVIVIDNIDRCHKDLAFELLLTVKTFLEQKDKNIIFILPIDEHEIKKHLNKEGHDGNEFLRKLFNTTLTIKKFLENDLFDFTKKLQKKYKLNLSEDALSLISQEFSKNPRKIIQFLNVLQTEIKLADEQEKIGNFKKGDITENIEFLVKVLLIREEWTSLYEKIRENPFLLDDINEQINNGNEKVTYGKNLFLTNEQKRFFEYTMDILTTNIEPFFSNKDVFPDFPDEWGKLVLARDWEAIKVNYLEKGDFDFNKIINFVDVLFGKILSKKQPKRYWLNVFSFIFKIAADEKYKELLLKVFYGKGKSLSKIKAKLNSKDVADIILKFDLDLLLNFAKTNLEKNNKLLQTIIDVINNRDNKDGHHENLVIKFVNEFQDKEEYLKEIGTRFSEMLKGYPGYFYEFKDVLEKPVTAGILIKENLLKEFIDNLKQNPDAENIEVMVKIINQYHLSKGLNSTLLEQYIKKIVEFLNPTNDLKILSFWFKQLSFLKKDFVKSDISSTVFQMLNRKYQTLYDWFTSYPDNEHYQSVISEFLSIASDLYIGDKLSENDDNNIKTWLQNFLNRTEHKLGWQIANLNYFKIVQELDVMNWDFSNQVINKFNQLPEWKDRKEIAKTLNLMLSKTTDEKGLNEPQIQSILNEYIDSIDLDKETVESWLYKAIENPIIKIQLSRVVSELSVDDKLNLLDVIKKLDKNLLKNCVEEIISETNADNLEENFEKLDISKTGRTLINGGIEKTIKNLKYEDGEDHFRRFLSVVIERKDLPENVRVAIVNKVSSFLHDDKTKEDKIFALQILDKIIVPKNKKTLVKEQLKDLNIDDFDDEEKALFLKVKKNN